MYLYEQLGVSINATTHEIKKAFQALALKHHPDKGKKSLFHISYYNNLNYNIKGGDAELFAKIKDAHDILIDPSLRLKYDKVKLTIN